MFLFFKKTYNIFKKIYIQILRKSDKKLDNQNINIIRLSYIIFKINWINILKINIQIKNYNNIKKELNKDINKE